LLQRPPHNRLFLLRDGVLRRVGCRGDCRQALIQWFRRRQWIAGFLPKTVANQIPRDSLEPWLELRGFLQLLEFSPRNNERFLGHVFALWNVSARAVSQAADRRLIARNQLAKRLAIPSQGPCHQRHILHGCDIRHDIQFHTRLTSGLELETVTENLRNNDGGDCVSRWVLRVPGRVAPVQCLVHAQNEAFFLHLPSAAGLLHAPMRPMPGANKIHGPAERNGRVIHDNCEWMLAGL